MFCARGTAFFWFTSKDVRPRGSGNWQPCPLGQGIVPIRDCVGAIKEAGYGGDLSHEYEAGEDVKIGLKQSVTYLSRLLKEIGSPARSGARTIVLESTNGQQNCDLVPCYRSVGRGLVRDYSSCSSSGYKGNAMGLPSCSAERLAAVIISTQRSPSTHVRQGVRSSLIQRAKSPTSRR